MNTGLGVWKESFPLSSCGPRKCHRVFGFIPMATSNSITKDTASFFLWEALLYIWDSKLSSLLVFIFGYVVMHCGYRNALFVTCTWGGKAINDSSLRQPNMGNVKGLCNAVWLEVFLWLSRGEAKGMGMDREKQIEHYWLEYTHIQKPTLCVCAHTQTHQHNRADTMV